MLKIMGAYGYYQSKLWRVIRKKIPMYHVLQYVSTSSRIYEVWIHTRKCIFVDTRVVHHHFHIERRGFGIIVEKYTGCNPTETLLCKIIIASGKKGGKSQTAKFDTTNVKQKNINGLIDISFIFTSMFSNKSYFWRIPEL